jgi:hypothetical protein
MLKDLIIWLSLYYNLLEYSIFIIYMFLDIIRNLLALISMNILC